MIDFIKNIIYILQKILLFISYYSNKIFYQKYNKIDWVIGVDEIAKFISLLKGILPNSYTISFSKNKFYELEYDFSIKETNKYLRYIYRIFLGPILLGFLMNKSNKFWYIGSTGFLINREYEFKFLKSKNKKIVCMFLGSEIRSPKLMLELYKKLDLDGFINYMANINNDFLLNKYDNKTKNIAKIADLYADLIFNAPTDQRSYLKSKQYFPNYFYDKGNFHFNENKFLFKTKIKILHAPSNPIIKGTPLVRAAIKKLKMEGYDFEYIELQNIPNSVVLEHLKNTHIVLNQFYAFVPGMFGIESLANHCAVLMSADMNIETTLPQNSKDAWMITKYWEVYDNLKYLLDNPEKIKYYADNGYKFAYENYTYEAASKYFNKILKDNGIVD